MAVGIGGRNRLFHIFSKNVVIIRTISGARPSYNRLCKTREKDEHIAAVPLNVASGTSGLHSNRLAWIFDKFLANSFLLESQATGEVETPTDGVSTRDSG